MFGRNRPVVLERYGRRRSSWRLPRWLVLLLLGVAMGAGGVVLLQERYLPPRLSADESTRLKAAYAQADADRVRLSAALAETEKSLASALADGKRLGDELAASQASVTQLKQDMATLVDFLPPDPRGGSVEVRGARFAAEGGALSYDLVLTRDRASGAPLAGQLQLLATGSSASGAETTVTLKPVTLSIGRHETARGSLPLPEGFRPRQVTVRVLDRSGSRQLGMRVLLVQ